MFGYWDALYFIFIFAVSFVLALAFDKWAKMSGMGTKKSGDGTKIFISGEDPEKVIPGFEHLEGYYAGRNVMWGLTYGLKRMFVVLQREHTGLLTDYVSYLLITTAFIMAVLLIWG